jgi:glycerate 2-kinase
VPRSAEQLRDDALAIWHAGLASVRSDRLLREAVVVDGPWLTIADLEPLDLRNVERVIVVGAGKAGAGMAAGLEQALGERLMTEKQLSGWVNVPADCAATLDRIHLHAARPAGVNEPTEQGVLGTRRILDLLAGAGPRDLCLGLFSGGGSALMPAPVEGISLSEKLAITRFLSGAGANIEQLNTVRKQISRVKGGNLARAWKGGPMVCLMISDVLGDPLEVIASGPTVADGSSPGEALAVLEEFGAVAGGVAPGVVQHLRRQAAARYRPPPLPAQVRNVILANNATAVDAAGMEAERRGYSHAMTTATAAEGAADELGRHHASLAVRMRRQAGPDCLITGGEPVVQLPPPQQRGRGGRNQQLVLAAWQQLLDQAAGSAPHAAEGLCLLSAGTDGEDGPTDAAGALIDSQIAKRAAGLQLRPADFLRRCDAFSFFQQADGLIRTGPTHTNVCDLRVVTVDRIALD